MLFVVFHLLGAAIFGNRNQRLHALRDGVGKKNHFAIDMPRGAAGRLDERSLAAQKSFLVRIENADERNFRKIETFPQQIDADENVEIGRAQAAQNFHALDRVDVAVQIAHFQSDIAQVIGQIFRRAFGQGGDENALLLFHPLPAKLDRIVDLVLERLERDLRIEQAGRANDLLDDERRARRVDIEFLRRLVGARDCSTRVCDVGRDGTSASCRIFSRQNKRHRFVLADPLRVCAGSSPCCRRRCS